MLQTNVDDVSPPNPIMIFGVARIEYYNEYYNICNSNMYVLCICIQELHGNFCAIDAIPLQCNMSGGTGSDSQLSAVAPQLQGEERKGKARVHCIHKRPNSK